MVLSKIDKASMYNSIESRSPFLGKDIINYRKKKFKKNEYFFDYKKKEIKSNRKMGHFTIIQKI